MPDGTVIRCDVCIVGSGAAGITMARRLGNGPLRVCLLESGGLEEEPESQALSQGENVGLPYYDLQETRSRVFGGSTNRWGGWCRPLDELDFEHRPWVAYSGWPITRRDLEPFYEQAAQLCQIGDWLDEPLRLGKAIPVLYRPPFAGGEISTTVWRASPPTKFGSVYRGDIEAAANVTALLHANAVELETDQAARKVKVVRVACLAGPEFRVQARVFVLAAGAIESARLLLASNRSAPDGLGNQNDRVGRFFMEHPHVVTGRIVLEDGPGTGRKTITALDRGITGTRARLALQRPAGGIKCGYTILPTIQEAEKLLNYSAHLTTGSRQLREGSEIYRSLEMVMSNMRSLQTIVRHRALPAGLSTHLGRIVVNPGEVARVLGGELLRKPQALEIYTQCEQAPNPDSRVTLGERRDALGVPRVRLDWRLSEIDKLSIRRSQQIIGAQLRRTGVGSLEADPWLMTDDDLWSTSLRGGHHHLGTARMSDDPKAGVVDRHCRVHGMTKLYVSDGSVFPTGGYANPLLTIVALALRTADHLRHQHAG